MKLAKIPYNDEFNKYALIAYQMSLISQYAPKNPLYQSTQAEWPKNPISYLYHPGTISNILPLLLNYEISKLSETFDLYAIYSSFGHKVDNQLENQTLRNYYEIECRDEVISLVTDERGFDFEYTYSELLGTRITNFRQLIRILIDSDFDSVNCMNLIVIENTKTNQLIDILASKTKSTLTQVLNISESISSYFTGGDIGYAEGMICYAKRKYEKAIFQITNEINRLRSDFEYQITNVENEQDYCKLILDTLLKNTDYNML